MSALPPKADLPPDLRTTSAASFSRMPPSPPRVSLVAVRPRAILMMFKGERPHPGRALRCRVHLHDVADDGGIGEHIVIVVVPLAGWAARRCALEDQRKHFARLSHIARRPGQLAGAESPAPRRLTALADAGDSSPERNAVSTATTKRSSMRRSCSRVQPPFCSRFSRGRGGRRTSAFSPPFKYRDAWPRLRTVRVLGMDYAH